MKIIRVGDYSSLENRMDTNAIRRAKSLDSENNIRIDVAYRGPKMCAKDIVKKYEPDIILHETISVSNTCRIKNLDKVSCKKVLFVGDEHSIDGSTMEDFDHIIFFYDNRIQKWKNRFQNKKFYHMPHHIDTNLFKEYDVKKEYDVLVYGNMNPNFYPNRIKITEELVKSKLVVKVLPYGTYAITGEPLVKEINKAVLALSTNSTVDYAVAKFFEIPACGTLCMGIRDNFIKTIFKDNFLDVDMKNIVGSIMEKINSPIFDIKTKMKKAKEIAKLFDLDHYVTRMHNLMNHIRSIT